MSGIPLRARAAMTVGNGLAWMSRATGRGDGSVIGGRVAQVIEPRLLSKLARRRNVALVSATNGKTTTTRLVATALGELGAVATNEHGANMPSGHVTALAAQSRAAHAVLEVDEKYLPQVLRETQPQVVALLNLSRDQMDRATEINLLAKRWRDALATSASRVVANADDPLVAWAGLGAPSAVWVSAGQRWKEDSWCCPECGGHLKRETDPLWECPECGLRRPEPSWSVDHDTDTLTGPDGQEYPVRLHLPGDANRANAALALATVATFGMEPAVALPRMREVASVAGRYTSVDVAGVELRLLLAKNPAGWLESFTILDPPPCPVLLAVNARGPDGRDTSWLWDVDYSVLRGRQVLVLGERSTDLALRLDVDGVDFEVVPEGTVDAALRRLSSQWPKLTTVDVIANYTAFQQIRAAYGRVV
ncbi:MurT ligase domain-containing protein [Lipingzhangella sp. LS1_29]|uniref:Lipid II isoglutaminyl synthase (glutamine-hydrolyzing) subunit MurT n=1 Tax=Lipingzhangella rawalii TaxID=2055835 RepID=A0ABU2H4N7_9ACTN|nr:MurT ligase domain-containing protein [Lipingzhangella rawalii]MDS1270256.1 MurT ligase domain-containing protein [Lipingzhangella rawalii]